jgi:predicted TIM-barrel fold metal-dependent hydrolase
MWGADYPHTEGTWPNSRESIAAAIAGMPEDDARRILGLNAVEFYGLDRKFLQGVADRIGPRKDELLPAAA